MKSLKKLSFIGLALMTVMTSCTMDKRLYTSGYTIQWHNKNVKQDSKEIVGNKSQENEQTIISPEVENTPELDNTISASIGNDLGIVVPKKEKIVFENNVSSDYKRIITMPIRKTIEAKQYVKSLIKGGGDKSRNWAAILGFILSFFVPFIAWIFCIIGFKSELRGLAIAGYIISITTMLIYLLLILSAG